MRRLIVGLAIAVATATPCWVRADDQQIAQQIVKSLRIEKDAGNLKGFGIDLQVDQGTVWLKGNVSSAKQRDLALATVRKIGGVNRVVDDLTIQASQPKAKLAATKPAAAKPTAAKPTPAKTAKTTRKLSGPTVRPAATFTTARKSAQATSARPASAAKSTASDDKLAREIMRRLGQQRDAGRLKGFSVQLKPNKGQVWVSGRVASEAQRTLVLNVASHVPGVKQVVNDLKVIPVAARPAQATKRPTLKPLKFDTSKPKSKLTASRKPATSRTTAPKRTSTPRRKPVAIKKSTPAVRQTSAARALPAPVQVAHPPVYRSQMPVAMAPSGIRPVQHAAAAPGQPGAPVPTHFSSHGAGVAPVRYDHPQLPGYAWPSYAAYPNYAALTYPKQYSPAAWPYIGPFYPYPQVPLGWRKVTLEWDDGWWMLDFKER